MLSCADPLWRTLPLDSTPHISVRGLTHVYDNGRAPLTALAGVDLDVERGAFVSIIGPSGGGKTTLLKILGGLLRPTEGSVTIDGISPEEAQRRRLLGFVFQDPSLLPWRTVLGNVALATELGGNSKSDRPYGLLETVGLAEFAGYYPHQLSGGMRQRVALARALAVDPDGSVDGRAPGSARRDNALRYALRAAPAVGAFAQDRRDDHSQYSGGGYPLGPRARHVREAWPNSDQLEIDLPRPRSEVLERSPDFLDYTYRIREVLSAVSLLDSPPVAAYV